MEQHLLHLGDQQSAHLMALLNLFSIDEEADAPKGFFLEILGELQRHQI